MRASAEDIISFFRGRKGFGAFWGDIDEDIKDEILDELQDLLDQKASE